MLQIRVVEGGATNLCHVDPLSVDFDADDIGGVVVDGGAVVVEEGGANGVDVGGDTEFFEAADFFGVEAAGDDDFDRLAVFFGNCFPRGGQVPGFPGGVEGLADEEHQAGIDSQVESGITEGWDGNVTQGAAGIEAYTIEAETFSFRIVAAFF